MTKDFGWQDNLQRLFSEQDFYFCKMVNKSMRYCSTLCLVKYHWCHLHASPAAGGVHCHQWTTQHCLCWPWESLSLCAYKGLMVGPEEPRCQWMGCVCHAEQHTPNVYSGVVCTLTVCTEKSLAWEWICTRAISIDHFCFCHFIHILLREVLLCKFRTGVPWELLPYDLVLIGDPARGVYL